MRNARILARAARRGPGHVLDRVRWRLRTRGWPGARERQPLVTVGLPVHNGGDRLAGALDSLLAQTYPNIEIVISDNASDDRTPDIIADYARRHSSIRAYRNDVNIGAPLNFQVVLDHARGAYFMWAADDDLWEPTFVESIMKGLLRSREYVTGFSQLDKFRHEDGSLIQKRRQPPEFGKDTSRAVDQMTYLRERCQWMALGIHRTDLLRKVMRLRRDEDYYQGFFDVYVPFRLIGYGRPYVVRKVLFHDGRHERSLTTLRKQGEFEAGSVAPALHMAHVSRAILLDSATPLHDRWRVFRHMWRTRSLKWSFTASRIREHTASLEEAPTLPGRR
jgi:hypothetical protein